MFAGGRDFAGPRPLAFGRRWRKIAAMKPYFFVAAFGLLTLAASLVSAPAISQSVAPGCKLKMRAEDMQPVASLQVGVSAEGKQSWVAVIRWGAKSAQRLCLADETARWQYIDGHIGKALAERQWCLRGWVVTDRLQGNADLLTVWGDCKSPP